MNKPCRTILVFNIRARIVLTKIQIFKKYHHPQQYCDIITESIILRNKIHKARWCSRVHTIMEGLTSVLNSVLMDPNLLSLSESS